MNEKLDFKKLYRDLYAPGGNPVLIDVPPIRFIMVDGCGDPQGEMYQQAIQLLYALSFTIKMSKMNGAQPVGYVDYVVPPLEGLWSHTEGERENWRWTSIIRQPDFVTSEVFGWAKEQVKKKKPELDTSIARLESFTEGRCVQLLHVGPYSTEPESISRIMSFIEKNNLRAELNEGRRHHEIYLSDPRRTAPERLKTILRLPVIEK